MGYCCEHFKTAIHDKYVRHLRKIYYITKGGHLFSIRFCPWCGKSLEVMK